MSNPTSERAGPPAVDYIVIGAGPAGCAVAARLAQFSPDSRVALIEAGPAKASALSDVPLGIALLVPFRSQRNYAYETTPQAGFGGRRGFQPRGRGLGGSSLINAMIYMRGQPQDYDSWAALGCKGWGWADVFPYFKRSEDNARGADEWHGVGGPLHVSDLAHRNPAVEAFVAAGGRGADSRATTISTARSRKAWASISCSRRTAGGTTPRAPISRRRPRPISPSTPTARRGASCSTASARSASCSAEASSRSGSTPDAR